MSQTVITLLAAILSGILATVITFFWQDYSQKKSNKNNIFNVLMAYRFKISEYESVKALNSVQALFYKNKSVQIAWKKFKQETDRIPYDFKRIEDAHTRLLEEIGKACGYKKLKWDEIKDYYYPTGLSDEINENERLRKANLQRAERDLNNQQNIQFLP